MKARLRILKVLADCMAAGEPLLLYKQIAHQSDVTMAADVLLQSPACEKSGALVTQEVRILELRLSAADAAVVLA